MSEAAVDRVRIHRPLPDLARELVKLTDMVVQNGHRTYALSHLPVLQQEIRAISDPYSDCNIHAWAMLAQVVIVITAYSNRDDPERAAQWAIIAGALRGMVLEDIKGLEQ